MSIKLHPLLQRQLKRIGQAVDEPPRDSVQWSKILERVSRAYGDTDQERYLMERSQQTASDEMGELNRALQLAQGRLESLISLSSDWIWEQDENLKFTYFSNHQSVSDLLDPSALIGVQLQDREKIICSESELERYATKVREHAPFRDFTFGFTGRHGHHLHMRICGEPVFDFGCFKGYRGVATDVTQAKLAEDEIIRLAHYDALTGLPNRRTFIEEMARAHARSQRSGVPFAVFFIDLDRFKHINDNMGHATGDRLLRVVGERLVSHVRKSDMVARLGGDEFVVLLEHCQHPEMLHKLARQVITSISSPLTLGNCILQVSGSIGISVYPDDCNDMESMLKHADAAMYLAKNEGKNGYRFYTNELAQRAQQAFALESDIRLALTRNEFCLHYQPKIDLANSKMIGMEALIRWQHPSRGLLPPGAFVPLAEDSGLIIEIGKWVIQAACQQLQSWRLNGYHPPPCAVNLSTRQFNDDSLVSHTLSTLASTQIEGQLLEMEITESLLMSNPERAQIIVRQLRELGIRFSIDDFGTGHSSLAYLKRFQAHALKIDRSFVKDLPHDENDIKIVQALVGLAHGLNMAVIAEGVESDTQVELLKAIGCNQAQGYYFAKPMPAAELAAFLSRNKRPHLAA